MGSGGDIRCSLNDDLRPMIARLKRAVVVTVVEVEGHWLERQRKRANSYRGPTAGLGIRPVLVANLAPPRHGLPLYSPGPGSSVGSIAAISALGAELLLSMSATIA